MRFSARRSCPRGGREMHVLQSRELSLRLRNHHNPATLSSFVAPTPPIDAARSHCISRPRARGLACRIRMTKSRAARLFEQNFSRARLPPQYAQRARSQPAIMQKMSVLQGVLQKRVAGSVSVKNFWMGSQVMLPEQHVHRAGARAHACAVHGPRK